MPSLIIRTREGENRTIEADADGTMMEAIRDAGFDELTALCGGACACATCHVYLDPQFFAEIPKMSLDEDELLDSSSHRTAHSRLSCRIRLSDVPSGTQVVIAPED